MLHPTYERMVQFASEDEYRDEIAIARKDYERRTGDLFESDPSYERRISGFLEWYVLDRPVGFGPKLTPARMYIDAVSKKMTTPQIAELRQLTRTVLSLFEYRGSKPTTMRVTDILTNKKYEVFERRKTAGLRVGDILEARLVPSDEAFSFSATVSVHPYEARKLIQKAAKRFRKQDHAAGRLDLVHRVAFLSNRCERYSHVDPREIFSELEAQAANSA